MTGASNKFKSFLNLISGYPVGESANLLSDCKDCFTCRAIEDGDNYSIGTTFFIRAEDAPSCGLEALALKIFAAHTAGERYDPTNSGAEWWTQYIDHRDDIGFHWDRDYGLEEDEGLHVHPHLGTVTYLTSRTAAPTVIFDKRGTFAYGNDASDTLKECILSYPDNGKHICFDGELLHGSPSSLAHPELVEDIEDYRVTFLVNIWINHVPIQSQRLDSTVAKSLRIPVSLVNQIPLNLSEQQMLKALKVPAKAGTKNHKWAISGMEYIIDINLPLVHTLAGVRNKTVVDVVQLKDSRIYPGELSASPSDESDDFSDINSVEENSEMKPNLKLIKRPINTSLCDGNEDDNGSTSKISCQSEGESGVFSAVKKRRLGSTKKY